MNESWEARMAMRATERALNQAAEEQRQRRAEEAERRANEPPPEPGDITYYEGPCDVCGQMLTMEWNYRDGTIDVAFTEEGRLYTWRRHGPEGPLQPDCDRYSSKVYVVPWDGPKDEQGQFLNTIPTFDYSDTVSTDVFICDVCGQPVESPMHLIPPQDVTVIHGEDGMHQLTMKARPFRFDGPVLDGGAVVRLPMDESGAVDMYFDDVRETGNEHP